MMKNSEKSMDKIIALCKNRGFVFAGSEIYGGLANSWDYGPLGVEFKNNVKKAWLKNPVGIRIDEVEKTMEAVPGVKAVHHIHVWAISTTENALTAHVVLAELPRMETVKKQLKAELETAGIHHVTLEFESSAEHCPGTCY